jgi:kynurenine aminotransferase
MHAAMTAFLNEGDEVILIEPYFDQYYASIRFQGAKTVFVPLHPPKGSGIKSGQDWKIDIEECVEKNVLVLADEVYDCMIYDDLEHVRIATLPGMWERTLTVGSGGSEWFSPTLFRNANQRILRCYGLACR